MYYMKALKKVGVRDLRQNLSIHLARVIAGETLEVTDRGHSVAVLAPLVRGESAISRLKRDGRLISATGALLAGSRRAGPAPRWSSRELQRERTDRTS